MNSKERAKATLKKLIKDDVKYVVKKTKAYKKAKEMVKDTPISLKTVGALGLALAREAAFKAEKKIKTGENSRLKLGASYDPRTKEKKVKINWTKDF